MESSHRDASNENEDEHFRQEMSKISLVFFRHGKCLILSYRFPNQQKLICLIVYTTKANNGMQMDTRNMGPDKEYFWA